MPYDRDCFDSVPNGIVSDSDSDDGTCERVLGLADVGAECLLTIGLLAKVVWQFCGTNSVFVRVCCDKPPSRL